MLGDKVFRISLLLSVTVHSALFTPWSGIDALFKDTKNTRENSVEINYLEIEVRPALTMGEGAAEPAAVKEAIAEIPTKGPVSAEKEREPAKAEPKPDEKRIEFAEKAIPKKEAQVGPEEPTGVYVEYYNLIRDKIRRQLTGLYRPYFSEGDVYLTFTLRSNGTLGKASILDEKSSSSPKLKEIAQQALRSSAPFPPFPNELKEPSVNFHVIVSFKK